jgi:two-component system, chemotaxis family, protein-glutamate methylesterase/glutaminase
MAVRTLIVDDSPTMRAVLRMVLEQDGEIDIVGAAADAREARNMIRDLNPDVLTLDIEMPGMNGLDFLEKIMALRPMPVIIVSGVTAKGAQKTMQALQMGAFECYAKPQGLSSNPVDADAGMLARLVHLAARHGHSRTQPAAHAPCAVTAAVPPTSRTLPPAVNIRPELIAIGSSTGGVEALTETLSDWDADCPPTLIVQHIFGSFAHALADRLDKSCPAKVVSAETDTFLRNGHVYIAPGNDRHLIVRGSDRPMSRLLDAPEHCGHRPSVNMLLRSVAQTMPGRALGIILTGMGSDGADGLLDMRNAGCATMAQDRATSLVYGMPRAATENGAAIDIVPLGRIAGKVRSLCRA